MNLQALNRLSLSKKLIAAFLSAGLVTALAVGLGSYVASSQQVRSDVEIDLRHVAVAAARGLDRYFESVAADLDYKVEAKSTQRALGDFSLSYGFSDPSALQTSYIDENPHPIGSKHLLDAAPGDRAYDKAHADHHPSFRAFLTTRGYYDIFLISTSGDIIYSVFKERDYATNLMSGPYADSGLADAFRAALNAEPGAHAFSDFKPYAPSAGAPAAFVASPVLSDTGETLGVIAMQIPSDRVAAAMRTGSESTYYAVGETGLLHTDLSETDGDDILQRSVSGDWLATAQNSADAVVAETGGVLGDAVLLSAQRTNVFGAAWVVVAEQPLDLALAPLGQLRMVLLATVSPVILLIAGGAYWLSTTLSSAIVGLSVAMRRVAKGDLESEVPGLGRGDEVGDMAQALESFRADAAVQLAVTAAVESSKTPTLLLNLGGEVIARNSAFKALWSRIGAQVVDLASGGAPTAPANFAKLIERADALERGGAELKEKQNGDKSLDIPHNGLILEIKRAPILDRNDKVVGAALEIEDVTAVRQIEDELMQVLEAVEAGQFNKRVSSIDHLGFTSLAGEGLNKLMASVGEFMDDLGASLNAMAEGDLTRPMQGDFRGDFAAAKMRFDQSLGSLRTTLQRVSEAAAVVQKDAEPIASGSRDLAARAESQASTLEQTAATMEEMAATIRENAQGAERAAELSRDASHLAEAGGQVVAETVDAMGRIESSASEISDIIGVIEGIAFQTNLLALNAAVEAARAGESGKGFAVVASEVRSLAQRSSEAAKDIKGLIEASSAHVSTGVSLVNRTGTQLSEVVSAIRSVAETINAMAASVHEMSSGVQEVTISVSHLDEMTQRNAALADQSASIAQGLHDAASALSAQIAGFKTDAGGFHGMSSAA